LESFLAGRNRPEAQSGERRGGPFHARIRITVLAGEKIRRLVVINCGFSFRVSFVIRTAFPLASQGGPAAGPEPAVNQLLNAGRFSAMNVSSDFGSAPPIF